MAEEDHKVYRRISLGDLRDLSYNHLSQMRSFDQLENRTVGVITNVEVTILHGLDDLAKSKKLEILPMEYASAVADKINKALWFNVLNEDKRKLFKIEVIKKWSGTQCRLLNGEDELILSLFMSSKGCGCCKKTLINVFYQKNKFMGSVVYRGQHAILFNSDGNKTLRIISKMKASSADNHEHVVVEIDNTKVGLVTFNNIRFTKCIDVNQRTLLIGAWLPVGLKFLSSTSAAARFDPAYRDVL